MNADSSIGAKDTNFGGAAAGLLFLSVLISYLFVNLIIATFLDLAWIEATFSIKARSENELAALKRVSSGVLGPCLMFLITISFLKVYFPRRSPRELLKNFGLGALPSSKTLLSCFIAGVCLALFFSKILALAFPPPAIVEPHPANIVNYGSSLEKILFVFSVVILAPIAEEFHFRGVLYSGFSKAWNKPLAAIFVSVCFILIHPETISSGYWLTHLLLVLITFVLIVVREITQTVVTCIFIHAGINFAIVFS